MRIMLTTGLCLLPLTAVAAPRVSCVLERAGDETVVTVPAEPDALGGRWTDLGKFRVRTVLAAPPARAPWLLVEVYSRADDGDDRLLSTQRLAPPFASGEVEVVEPGLGRSLRYTCAGAE